MQEAAHAHTWPQPEPKSDDMDMGWTAAGGRQTGKLDCCRWQTDRWCLDAN